MFSSEERVRKRTGPYGVGRLSYLQSLVTEFEETNLEEARSEVLANLANFAYDPLNYEYFRKLNVLDLFLDCLARPDDDQIKSFAVCGICNCCLDKKNKAFILANDGVNLVSSCLSSNIESTVLSSITALMYLTSSDSHHAITSSPIRDAMKRLSSSVNPRISNLATIFLEDYCEDRWTTS